MNRGWVDLDLLRANGRKADFSGKTAYCFIRGDNLIKVYANKYDKELFIPLDITKLCDFSGLSANTIAFPIEYLYEDDKIVGEVLPYIKSKMVNESFNNKANIKNIIDSYEELYSDIELYSNINMYDLCYVNILYSNQNGFHLIDTTEWEFTDNAFKENVHRLNSSLIEVIVDSMMIPVVYSKYYNKIDETYYNNMAKYGNAGKRLQNNMDLIMSERFRFLELLFAYMEVYRIHYGKEMETLKDMKEMTKVLKKG